MGRMGIVEKEDWRVRIGEEAEKEGGLCGDPHIV